MSNPVDLTTAVSEAIREVTALIKLWLTSKNERRLRAAVDIADRIFKRYNDIVPIENRDKIISKWIGEFYNRMI